jgi:hypothetical protein
LVGLKKEGFLATKHVLVGERQLYYVPPRGVDAFVLEYPAIRQINPIMVRHNIAVVDTMLFLVKKRGFCLQSFLSEREVLREEGYKFNSKYREHIPDFLYQDGEEKIAVEVELATKAKQRIQKNFAANMVKYDKQIWVISEKKKGIRDYLLGKEEQGRKVEVISLEQVRNEVYIPYGQTQTKRRYNDGGGS